MGDDRRIVAYISNIIRVCGEEGGVSERTEELMLYVSRTQAHSADARSIRSLDNNMKNDE
jgi:hypothetical protein